MGISFKINARIPHQLSCFAFGGRLIVSFFQLCFNSIALVPYSMASSAPTVLILGHSFVKRFKSDLESNFDPRVDGNFHLEGSASVHMFGVGVERFRSFESTTFMLLQVLLPTFFF